MDGRSRASKKNHIPDDIIFKTKPQSALSLIDRINGNGIEVMAWTADELYGRDGAFLDGLDERNEAFVVEIPPNAHMWLSKPKVLKIPARNVNGRPKKYPRLRRRDQQPSEVQNLAKYSPVFREQTPQRYRINDTHHGEEVGEIRWETCWRKTHTAKLVSKQCTLIVARNVLTGETKYFLSNRVPGRDGWSLRKLLRVAFGRWPVENCFREAKEELGWDHFECRGWRCIHRHLYIAILSQLFCAQVRQKLSASEDVLSGELLTVGQVRQAVNVFLDSITLTSRSQPTLPRRSPPPNLLRSPQRPGVQVPSKETSQATRGAWNRPRQDQVRTTESPTMLSSKHQTWRCPAKYTTTAGTFDLMSAGAITLTDES